MQEPYIKDFNKWNHLSQYLDKKPFKGFFHEREIWWCSLGVNIGSEEDGKNDLFERPVLIVRKLSENMALIVPLTSKIKEHEGRITVSFAGGNSQILILQIRAISAQRLLRRDGFLRIIDFQRINIKLMQLILGMKLSEPQL